MNLSMPSRLAHISVTGLLARLITDPSNLCYLHLEFEAVVVELASYSRKPHEIKRLSNRQG